MEGRKGGRERGREKGKKERQQESRNLVSLIGSGGLRCKLTLY